MHWHGAWDKPETFVWAENLWCVCGVSVPWASFGLRQESFSSWKLNDAYGFQQSLAICTFQDQAFWLQRCCGSLYLLQFTQNPWVTALASRALLLCPLPVASCWEPTRFTICACSGGCTLMLLLSPTFSWGSSSLLLFHLHSFHLVPHFWMAREVRGRRRLQGSKMPWRPWSWGMPTNAWDQRGDGGYSRRSRPKGEKKQGFVLKKEEQCWRDAFSFSWGSRMGALWPSAYQVLVLL